MTKSNRILLISIVLLTMGAANPVALLAAKGGGQLITVEQINPIEAQQGDAGVPVNLKGSGFGPRAKVVFLEKGTDIVGNINVRDVVFDDESGDLNFTIDVGIDAKIVDYEVEVSLAGRKGKGTTFTVRERLHQSAEVGCEEFDSHGTCNCRFMKDPDTRIFSLIDDCKTSENLVLNDARIVGLNGGSNGVWPTITAVNCDEDSHACEYSDGSGELKSFAGGFLGSSVVVNESESAGVRYLKIRFEAGVARGCGNGIINTAVSFILDSSTLDDPARNSFLQVRELDVDTFDANGNEPLCTAIELIRDASFNPGAPGYKDWKINVENSLVADGSYVESGIRLEGFLPQQDINPPTLFSNYIGAPACPGVASAAAIEFGRILLSDGSQIAGVVESNIIRMAGCGTPGGAGIWVMGDDYKGEHMTAVEVIKNDISGAFIGVLVDQSVDSAHFSGNTLTGDPDDPNDIGICSGASSTSTKGKPNVWSGYDANHELVSTCP